MIPSRNWKNLSYRYYVIICLSIDTLTSLRRIPGIPGTWPPNLTPKRDPRSPFITPLIIQLAFHEFNSWALTCTQIKKIINKIFIRELRFKIYHFDEYIILIFYMKDVLLDNIRVFIKIIKEIYIINDLKIKIFIKVDILILERINIDFVN